MEGGPRFLFIAEIAATTAATVPSSTVPVPVPIPVPFAVRVAPPFTSDVDEAAAKSHAAPVDAVEVVADAVHPCDPRPGTTGRHHNVSTFKQRHSQRDPPSTFLALGETQKMFSWPLQLDS